MILSMTGFGHSKAEINGKVIRVELKSLNARSTEIRCKLPNSYRDREMDLRKKVIDSLQRGKLDLTVTLDGFSDEENTFINADAFRKYYKELNALRQELEITEGDILQSVLRIPNVIGQNEELADDAEWHLVEQTLDEAIVNIKKFRADEGLVLKADLIERIKMIDQHLKAIEPYEVVRLDRIKDRLKKNMEEFAMKQQVDQNRYEQEILYYIEKLDINEEKVRLSQHCIYFMEELDNKDDQKGRKLSFIAQEIGREINTIGAKAQDSDIQQFVVMMKDELEKLKEQLANIL
ncbi:MAG: YicC family protein [Saprospiraceae bacterium]|nr:YicC family protein [Saprospiraceae bacterium]MBK8668339.1 YicC family protein [Saprospiraceae bacterium]MBL0099172.1 YicC family protein [Saprospiraceae bacterium]